MREKTRVSAFKLNEDLLITFDYTAPFDLRGGRFRIDVSNVETLFPNEKLIEALNVIRSNFPLSVIEKKQVLRKLEKITAAFWIADVSGTITLANRNTEFFCAVTNPLGEKESDAFFSSVWERISSLNEIVIKNKSAAVKEKVRFGRNENALYDVIKFPIVNAKDEVVAICGIIQASDVVTLYDKKENYLLKAFSRLPFAAALFDYEGNLAQYSEGFSQIFSGEGELLGMKYSQLFPKNFASEFSDFLLEESGDEKKFTLRLDEEKESAEVTVRKIFNEKRVFIGSLVIFENEKKENFTKILEIEMIETLLNASPDPMFIYDVENLKFLAVNDAALKFYGYSREQFLQMDLTDLYTPEDIQTLIEFNNSEISEIEKPVKHKLKDGGIAVVQLRRKELEFEGRKAFLTVAKDVTQKNEINKSLRELKALFEVSNEMIFETDADGFIAKVNKSVNKNLGYSEDEVIGKSFVALLSENFRSKINKKIFLEKITSQTELEAAVKTKRGALKNVKLVAVPLYDVFDKINGYALILILQEAEQPASATPKKAEEDNSQNSGASIDASFLSHLFHEILTPINVIIGFTQELLDSLQNPTEEQRESAQIIAENQQALMQLLDAATEYAAIEQNQTRIKHEEFAIVEVLDKIEENVRKTAQAHGVELKYGKISSSIMFYHDKHLTVMFLSMLWEFAVRGAQEKHVYFAAQPQGEFALITIKDNKDGISEGLLKAMNEFLSEDEALVRRNYNVSRFAIRLFRKLAELLGVQFEEVEKKSAVIAFGAKLPLKAAISEHSRKEENLTAQVAQKEKTVEKINRTEPKVEREIPSAKKVQRPHPGEIKTKSISPQVASKIDLSKLSCLLLEDQVDSQLLFKQQMKELKEIEVFAKFEDAIPILRSKKFDFVVMDINLLGDYNGLEALREIKSIPQYRNVPVIASTAYMMPGDQERYVEAGFDAFIPKPILKNKLLDVLKKVL